MYHSFIKISIEIRNIWVKLSYKNFRCPSFHVSAKKIKRWKCRHVIQVIERKIQFSFLSLFHSISYVFFLLLLIILYKLCRNSFFLFYVITFISKRHHMNSSYVISHEIKNMLNEIRIYLFHSFFQNYWKWIKIVENKMHIIFKFY